MFKKRYEPHIKGDKVTIIDNKTQMVRPFMFFYYIVTMILAFVVVIDEDTEGKIIGILFFGSINLMLELLIVCLERKYVIKPESLSIRYGIFGKTIKYDRVKHCFFNDLSHITLIDDRGRESVIELLNLPKDADKFFINSFKNANIQIRKIDSFGVQKEGTNYNYKFKMKQKHVVGYNLLSILGICFIAPMLIVFIVSYEPGYLWFLILMELGGLGLIAFLFWMILKSTATVFVNGGDIEFRRWLKKSITIKVKDISYVYTELRESDMNKNGHVEVMDIYVGKEKLKLSYDIGRTFKNYDLFEAYLYDNGIRFALDKDGLTPLERFRKMCEKNKK